MFYRLTEEMPHFRDLLNFPTLKLLRGRGQDSGVTNFNVIDAFSKELSIDVISIYRTVFLQIDRTWRTKRFFRRRVHFSAE